jgi:hypothetical protein
MLLQEVRGHKQTHPGPCTCQQCPWVTLPPPPHLAPYAHAGDAFYAVLCT